jgi:rhodanese-related sulfurtransferase
MTAITPRELGVRLERGEKPGLLDVRASAEHAAIHVPGVHLVPLDRLDATWGWSFKNCLGTKAAFPATRNR